MLAVLHLALSDELRHLLVEAFDPGRVDVNDPEAIDSDITLENVGVLLDRVRDAVVARD